MRTNYNQSIGWMDPFSPIEYDLLQNSWNQHQQLQTKYPINEYIQETPPTKQNGKERESNQTAFQRLEMMWIKEMLVSKIE